MKATMFLLLAGLSTGALAQQRTDTVRVDVTANLKLAGEQLENAADWQVSVLPAVLLFYGVGAYELTKPEELDHAIGWTMIGTTTAAFIAVQIPINKMHRRAARALQGKPLY